MSLSGISSPYDTQALASLLQVSSASTDGTSGVAGTTDGGAGQPQVSKQAKFLSKLQQLATSDPAKFKQVVTDIAAKLTQAAQQSGQTSQGQALSGLAAKFQTAAQTGDVSALEPAKPAAGAVQAAYGSGGGAAATLQSLTGQQGTAAGQGAGGHHGHHHHGGGASGGSTPGSTTSSPSASPNALTSLFNQINQEVAAA